MWIAHSYLRRFRSLNSQPDDLKNNMVLHKRERIFQDLLTSAPHSRPNRSLIISHLEMKKQNLSEKMAEKG